MQVSANMTVFEFDEPRLIVAADIQKCISRRGNLYTKFVRILLNHRIEVNCRQSGINELLIIIRIERRVTKLNHIF